MNFSYFVQKKGASIGDFETANALRACSCEWRPFFMSEQLTFPSSPSEWPQQLSLTKGFERRSLNHEWLGQWFLFRTSIS